MPTRWGVVNYRGVRECSELRWEQQALDINRNRSLWDIIRRVGRVTAESVMRDEADVDNAQFDAAYPAIPLVLKSQYDSKANLRAVGIDQLYFETYDKLVDALQRSTSNQEVSL